VLRLFLILAAFLAATLSSFAQVRSVARPAPVATPVEDASDEEEADDEDEATPPAVTAQTPLQNVAPPVTVVTPPPRPLQPNAPAPNQNQPAAGSNFVRLQFPNSDVDDVLRLYEQLTGLKLVRDNFVQGKVNIFISKDVPKDEAIRIIEINLLMNGFSLVPAGEGIVKVIGTGKNPRTTGVPIISDESQIPTGDHVISYLFKLRYADPQELQTVLQQYLSPPQPYTALQALPKSSTLLVTENSSVIRMLVKIIDQVDIPPAEVVSEFIKLERADASKVVDMLKDIFEKGQGTTPGVVPGGGVRPVRPAPVPQPQQVANMESDVGGLMALSEEAVVVGKIKLTPDVRTNRIHVVTRPINMPFIRKLIAEFDANVEFAKPVTRALKYISAGDVLPVLVQALTEPGTQGGAGGEGGPGGLGPNNAANQQQRQNSLNRAGNPNNPNSGSSYAGGASDSGGSLNVSEELSTNAVDTTPKSVSIGNAKIIADQRANTIIVLGNREVVVKVEKILDEMDVSAPQVALSTVIGELTLNGNEEFGVDWFLKYKNKVVGISRNTGAPIPGPTLAASPGASPVIVSGIIDPAGLVNFGQALQQVAGGTNVYVAAGNYLASIVHLLESTGKFKVVSRPTVFTSNNKKAIIASGQEVPVPVNTLTNATTTTSVAAVASSIQYKKIALQLEVVPLINSESEVSLDILQKIDSIAGSTQIDGNNIPTIATRYIRTTVSAPNCATIVLGGLIADNKRKDYTGVPWFSRIPLLGAAFRSTVNNNSRQELIVLMRPEVALSKLDLMRLRQKNEDHSHFGPEIEQDDCPDCPKQYDGKELPAPDLPPEKVSYKGK
jgi:general secretion pathway protein D